MLNPVRDRRGRLLLALLGVVFLASLGRADEPQLVQVGADAVREGFWDALIRNMFNVRGLRELLGRPEFATLAFVAINLIVFIETGLLVGFFLPGDSLLVTAGLVAYGADWNLPLLLVTVSLSAIVGDSLGYSIGYRTGPRIFQREKSWFFNKDHLL